MAERKPFQSPNSHNYSMKPSNSGSSSRPRGRYDNQDRNSSRYNSKGGSGGGRYHHSKNNSHFQSDDNNYQNNKNYDYEDDDDSEFKKNFRERREERSPAQYYSSTSSPSSSDSTDSEEEEQPQTNFSVTASKTSNFAGNKGDHSHKRKRKGAAFSDSSDSSLSDSDSPKESRQPAKKSTSASVSGATVPASSSNKRRKTSSGERKSLFDVLPPDTMNFNFLGTAPPPASVMMGMPLSSGDSFMGHSGILGAGPLGGAASSLPGLGSNDPFRNLQQQRISKFSSSPQMQGPILPQPTPQKETLIEKQARRVYVGNVPKNVDEGHLMAFFEEVFTKSGLFPENDEQNPNSKIVVGHQLNKEKNYIFLDLATPQHATTALKFDGLKYLNYNLKFRKPNMLNANQPQSGPQNVMSVQNQNIGQQGFETEQQLAGAPGMESEQPPPMTVAEMGINAILNFQTKVDQALISLLHLGANSGAPQLVTPSNVMVLINTFSDEDLFKIAYKEMFPSQNNNNNLLPSIQTIKNEIGDECSRYGRVKNIVIPLPSKEQLELVFKNKDKMEVDGADNNDEEGDMSNKKIDPVTLPMVTGLGKIFVQFFSREEARMAQQQFGGKKYRTRTCVTTYHDPQSFEMGVY